MSNAKMKDHVAAVEVTVSASGADAGIRSGSASVFFSDDHRAELRAFLAVVEDLQRIKLFFVYGKGARSATLPS